MFAGLDKWTLPGRLKAKVLVDFHNRQRCHDRRYWARNNNERHLNLKKPTMKGMQTMKTPTVKLPVIDILKEAARLIAENFGALVSQLFPILVVDVLALVGLAVLMIFNDSPGFKLTEWPWRAVFIGLLLLLPFTWLIATVGFYRIFLFGPVAGRLPFFHWPWRELWFGLWLILIPFLSALICLPVYCLAALLTNPIHMLPTTFTAINPLVLIPALLPFVWVNARLSLVFPAAAIGELNIGINQAWNLSRHNGWRLTLLLSIVPVCYRILLSLLPETGVVAAVIGCFAGLLTGLLEIAILVCAYRKLGGVVHLPAPAAGTCAPDEQSGKADPVDFTRYALAANIASDSGSSVDCSAGGGNAGGGSAGCDSGG
jgi:hypothetical protein